MHLIHVIETFGSRIRLQGRLKKNLSASLVSSNTASSNCVFYRNNDDSQSDLLFFLQRNGEFTIQK